MKKVDEAIKEWDKMIEEKKKAILEIVQAEHERGEVLLLRTNGGDKLARIIPIKLAKICLLKDKVNMAELDKIHAWAHDMLDEQLTEEGD